MGSSLEKSRDVGEEPAMRTRDSGSPSGIHLTHDPFEAFHDWLPDRRFSVGVHDGTFF